MRDCHVNICKSVVVTLIVLLTPQGVQLCHAQNRTLAVDTVLEGHGAWVNAVKFSPDGTMLASAGEDRTLWLWGITQNRKNIKLMGSNSNFCSIAFSASGNLLASAGQSEICVWNLNGAMVSNHRIAIGSMANVRFLRSEDEVVYTSTDAPRTWNIKTNQESRYDAYPGGDGSTSLDVSSDAKSLAIVIKARIVVYNTKTGAIDKVSESCMPGRDDIPFVGGIRSRIAFSPSGKSIAVSCGRKAFPNHVHLWDISGNRLASVPMDDKDDLLGIAFAPNGKLLACGGTSLFIWDIAAQKMVGYWFPSANGAGSRARGYLITAVDFSPDGTRLAIGGSDGSIKILRMTEGSSQTNDSK